MKKSPQKRLKPKTANENRAEKTKNGARTTCKANLLMDKNKNLLR